MTEMQDKAFEADVLHRINVGRIEYMNDAPVYYGLDVDPRPSWLNLVSGPPAMLNHMLNERTLDISPVSSAAYGLRQTEWLILPNISISCFGSVMSVLLVSKLPFEALAEQPVLLTDESATGVALLKLLFAWKKITPVFKTGKVTSAETFDQHFQGALVIGDAALNGQWAHQFAYVWDLGEIWRGITGLPFVFALWAVRRSFADAHPQMVSQVIRLFEASKVKGMAHVDSIALAAAQKLGVDVALIRQYYHVLRFDLGEQQIEGLNVFFDGLHKENLIRTQVQLNFFT